jgi:hypothetical protein
MRFYHRWIVVAVALLAMVACSSNQVTGNGKTITKARQLAAFEQVKINGFYKVDITQGDQQSVTVTTDSNIEPFVMTQVQGKVLTIYNKSGTKFKVQKPVLIQIIVKRMNHITASGANQITASNLNGDDLSVNIAGSNDLVLSGVMSHLAVEASGVCHLSAGDLNTLDVDIHTKGSCQVTVHAKRKLVSNITGNGDISYKGNPMDIEETIVGSGRLTHIHS